MQPLQYPIYKGTGGKHGALQFNFQPPHYYLGKKKDFTGEEALIQGEGRPQLRDGWKTRDGAIFLEITSAKGKNEYDWANKIVFALSPNDMSQILFTLLTGEDCKIMHDPGAKTDSQGAVKKYLNISSPRGVKEGVMVTASIQAGGEKRSHTVPVSGHEVVALKVLLERAIHKALAW